MKNKAILTWAAVVVVHFATSAFAIRDVIGDITHWGRGADLLLYSYIFGWDWHALTTDPLNLFNTNIFFPAKNTLASSDHRLGLLIFWVIPWLLTKRQFLSDGVALYLAYAITGVTTHIWVKRWTGDHFSAGLAAIFTNLTPLRIFNAGAVHIVAVMWLPIALLAMDEYMVKGGKRWWALMVLMFWLQFNVSFYLAYGMLLAMGMYFVGAMFLRPIADRKRAFIGVAVGCVLLFVALIPLVLPYMRHTASMGARMLPLIENSPSFPDFFLSSYSRNWFWTRKINLFSTDLKVYPLWLGLGIPMFSIIGFISSVRNRSEKSARNFAILIGAVSLFLFTLTLGPYLKFFGNVTRIPTPFLLLMKVAPGFDKMNVPYRFLFVMIPVLAALMGLGIKSAATFISNRVGARGGRMAAISALALFTCADIYCKVEPPLQLRLRDEPREVTKWLATQKFDGGIIELPFPEDNYTTHTLYMIQSLHHFHPIVNGYGSFFPPEWAAVNDVARQLPEEYAIKKLATLGIKTYVLHTDMTDFARFVKDDASVDEKSFLEFCPEMKNSLGIKPEFLDAFRKSPALREVAAFPKDYVFVYQTPADETMTLVGSITGMIPAEQGQILLTLSFVGRDGKKWFNPFWGQSLHFKIRFQIPNTGADAILPVPISLNIAEQMISGAPFEKVVSIRSLPPPGVYVIKIETGLDNIVFNPITADMRPPQ